MSDKKVIEKGVYKDKVFSSMSPKKVLSISDGVVTLESKKYMSDEHDTISEKRFLKENYLLYVTP